MQELVYKQGQAGITKATVSIIFNNEDKQNSPVGFDHDDKITVTRQVLRVTQLQASLHNLHTQSHQTWLCVQPHGVMQLIIGGRNKYLINGHNAQPR